MMIKLKVPKSLICLFFASAFTSDYLLRCESLDIEYYVCDFRRLASDQLKVQSGWVSCSQPVTVRAQATGPL